MVMAKQTILIVEDDPVIALMEKKKLEKLGFLTDTVARGEDALKRFEENNIDLMLLDYRLLDMMGSEVIKKLGDRVHSLLIVFVAEFGDARSVVEMFESGVDDYVVKDIELNFIKLLPKIVSRQFELKHIQMQYLSFNGTHEQRVVQRTEELKDSEAKYRKLIETANDAIFVSEAETGIIIDANKRAEELIGFPLEEIIGMHKKELHPEGEYAYYERIFYEQAYQGSAISENIVVINKDGIRIPVEVSASAFEWGGKRFLHGIFRDITERKRANEQIHKLSHAIDHSTSVVVITDIRGNIEYVNPKFTELTSFTRDEAIGKNPRVLKTPNTPPELYRELWKTILSGNEWRGEFCNRKKGGDLYWESASISPVRNAENVITHFIAIKEDITEKKRAESRMSTQHMVTKILAESGSIREASPKILQAICTALEWDFGEIWLINQEDNVLSVSDFWHKPSRVFDEFITVTKQISFPSKIGLPGRVWEISKPVWIEDVIRDTNFPRTAVAEKEGLHGAFGVPITNGNEVLGTICFFSHDIRQPDKDLLEMMVAIGIQIGLFIKRKQSDQLLKESEEKYRRLVETAQDAIVCDLNGAITVWNKSAEKIFGYSQCEIKDQPVTIIIPERYKKAYKAGVERLTKTGDVMGKQTMVEVTGRTKEGRAIPLEMSLSFQIIKKGEYFCTAIFRDLTEKQLIQKELTKIQRLESLGLLAGGIAHDFNNYLAGIMGNIALAKMDTDKREKAYDKLVEAEKAILRTRNLVFQLLTFSKGGAPIMQTASIKEIIRESIAFCLRGSNATGQCSFPDNLWPVKIDEGQIGQVINNLIINADQAMPQGGNIKVWAENITLDTKEIPTLKKGNYVKITVQDQGVGIPDGKIQEVFDPFFTMKERGNGLGLSVCYSIIKKHGGYICVESQIGSGTSFIIYILASEKAILKNEERGDDRLEGAGKILVVDDNEHFRITTGELLKSIGYDVDLACDGNEAITLYREAMELEEPFDVVILDLTIPGGMGGERAIKELLKIDPDVKAIVSSGYSNDQIMSNYREYGFRGIVTKPFEVQDLNNTLRGIIMS
ncbi:MAG: hypothetical protein SCALA701_00430 [Candidatus Scalindua sp.]|nr:PAS domain S-box protein [Planctomycetota bacterium]GJQ57242.1 MAG: hypothetical protein SCALA701_00430 [Candidatus Scalindua sp.]